MDALQFKNRVLAILAPHGAGFVDGPSEVASAINDSIRRFARHTECLYDDKVAFTLAIGDRDYPLRGSSIAFAREMKTVHRVVVDGNALLDPFGVEGPTDRASLPASYLTAANARPRHWWIQSKVLMLSPAPDQVYSNCFVSGPCLPARIDFDSPTATVPVPEEFLNALASWCAMDLAEPNATGEADMMRLQRFDARAWSELMDLKRDEQGDTGGDGVRGGSPRWAQLGAGG